METMVGSLTTVFKNRTFRRKVVCTVMLTVGNKVQTINTVVF